MNSSQFDSEPSILDSLLIQSFIAQQRNHSKKVNEREISVDAYGRQLVTIQTACKRMLGAEALFRFHQDNQKLTTISCESLATPIAFGVRDESTISVFESPTGTTLSQFDIAGLSLLEKIDFAIDLLKAIEAVHECGLVHRNIQASNIYVCDKQARLYGLGIDRFLHPSEMGDEWALGFATYVSPELSGALIHDIGTASDLYSAGTVLFELFSGRAPFLGKSVNDILFKHLTNEPPIDELLNHTPSAIRRVLACLLHKDPPQRYQLASSILFDLQDIRHQVEAGHSTDEYVICRKEIKPDISDPAFVGRKEELALLKREIGKIKAGRVRQAMVSCPSGIGKSRLILEFMRHASKDSVTVLCGKGSNEAGREPMAPILEVIHQLGERISGSQQLTDSICAQLEGHEAEIASACPEFAASIQLEVKAKNLGPDEFGQNRIENAVAKLVASLASPDLPLMIWIDDCQWLDEQTCKILRLVRDFNPNHMLLLFSMRSECRETVDGFLKYVKLDRRIELGPLSDKEVALLQDSMTGPLPPVAANTVVKHAAGSPFMASAVIRGMFESGAITPHVDGWKIDVDELSRIQAADDVAQVLLHRLKQLPDETLNLLSIAAIIGKEFDVQAVSEICNSPEFHEHVDLAREKRLIWSRPFGVYSFVHDKIRESLLELLDSDEKQKSHLRIAQYLEHNRKHRVFDLAFHFHRANHPDKALPYALKAAEIARSRFALDVAEQQLKISLAGVEQTEPATKYKIYSAYADIVMLDGRYDESERWLETAGQFTKTLIQKANVVFKRGELEFKRGNKEQAVTHFESALDALGYSVPQFVMPHLLLEVTKQAALSVFPNKLVGTKGDSYSPEDRLAWRIFSKLAHGYWYTRDKYCTFWAHLRGLNLAERYTPTPELAQAYSEHAPGMSLLPWHGRGIEYADRSLELRKTFGDVWGQGQSRNFKSTLLYSASEFEKCIEQGKRAANILQRTGDYWEVHIARYQVAAALYRQGDLKNAAREAQETYNSALELGDYQSTGNIIDVWVRANLNRIPDEVIERESNRTLRDTQGQCQIFLAHGISELGKQNYAESIENFENAIKLSRSAGILNTYITPNYSWLATALRLKFISRKFRSRANDSKPLKRLVKTAKKAVKVARSFKNELPHSLRELGAAYGLLGDYRLAKKYFLEGIEISKIQGAKYEQAQTENIMAQFAHELDLSEWQDLGIDFGTAKNNIREIEATVGHKQEATKLSIFDRFENLLEAGRIISKAKTHTEVASACADSANRLLRSQKAILIDDLSQTSKFQNQVGMNLVYQCIKSRKVEIGDTESICNDNSRRCEGSYIASPIVSDGKVTSVLYAGNNSVTGLFGDDEVKIVEYLAATTGSALEKAESFSGLEQMNENLEKRVEERTAIIEARSQELEATATALRETQKSLERACVEAQHANDAKSEFLARMSHEIRTPIAAIVGFAELMLRGVVPEKEYPQKLETILTSGRHLLSLINNLLDLSKIEADRLETELIQFNPSAIANEVIQSLAPTATEKGLSLIFNIENQIPRSINSDPTRFRQILTNLIGNAIKFTESGAVQVNAFFNEEHEAEEVLCFEVLDTGIGMTPAQCNKVFDRFAQADTSITRKFGGTGLGLSISKRLAQELGGDIQVTSQLGRGSSFVFKLKLEPTDFDDLVSVSDDVTQHGPSPVETKLTAWEENRLNQKRILVVDDAETNRELMRLILQDCGANVVTCENGKEAIEQLMRKIDFDVVLMDMQMPVLDGYNATRQLRNLKIDVPVIALTANSMKNDDAKCMEAGCSDYLSKPVDTAELIRKITLHLSDEATKECPHPLVSQNDFVAESEPVESQRKLAPLDFGKLQKDFRGRVFARLTDLQSAVNDFKFEEIQNIGHWIKGTAGMIGLEQIGDLGSMLNDAGRGKLIDQARAATDSLQKEICATT